MLTEKPTSVFFLHKKKLFLGAILGLSVLSGNLQAEEIKTHTLLVYPGTGKADIPMVQFREGYRPLVESISASMKLEPKLTRKIQKLTEHKKSAKSPAFVFGPPQAAAEFMDAGYIPLVRLDKKAEGVIVSAKDISQVTRVGYPDPESWLAIVGNYSAHQLIKNTLQNTYYRTQDDVISALKLGEIEAGSLRNNTLEKLQKEDPSFVAIIKLPATADFTFLANPKKTSQAEQAALKAVLLNMSPAVQQGLADVTHVKVNKFVEAEEQDYEVLRRIIAAEEKIK